MQGVHKIGHNLIMFLVCIKVDSRQFLITAEWGDGRG